MTADDPFDDGLPPARGMTLAEAQALECNRCGDCCDSRRARLASPRTRWSWGSSPAGYRDLIVPLIEVMPGVLEDDVIGAVGDFTAEFRCNALAPQPDGSALCGRHDVDRPGTCETFPVFGSHGEWLQSEADASEEGVRWVVGPNLPRCTWYRVYITAAAPRA